MTLTIDWQDVIRQFITLFVVIDPIGSIPVFLHATRAVPRKLHIQFAFNGVAIATVVLLGFLVAGQPVLEALGLQLGSFQIAGGLILFIFALTMIFGDSKPAREIEQAERDDLSGAVFPLAMPSIASPGAMLAVVVLTDNHRNSVSDQAITAGILFVVLLIALVLLLLTARTRTLIGPYGASVISRVMGILLAAVAVDAVLGGLSELGLIDFDGGSPAEL